jgi:hypothetical protein
MTWTRTRPTVPGLYWFRARKCKASIVEIVLSPAGFPNMVTLGTDQYSPYYYESDGEWAGPIPEPKEAA